MNQQRTTILATKHQSINPYYLPEEVLLSLYSSPATKHLTSLRKLYELSGDTKYLFDSLREEKGHLALLDALKRERLPVDLVEACMLHANQNTGDKKLWIFRVLWELYNHIESTYVNWTWISSGHAFLLQKRERNLINSPIYDEVIDRLRDMLPSDTNATDQELRDIIDNTCYLIKQTDPISIDLDHHRGEMIGYS